jgi:hypothetical protein
MPSPDMSALQASDIGLCGTKRTMKAKPPTADPARVGGLPDSILISMAPTISVPGKQAHGWTRDDRSGRVDAMSERVAAALRGEGSRDLLELGFGAGGLARRGENAGQAATELLGVKGSSITG